MELRQIQYFLTVAKHLNFRIASEKLHISQPALSQQIKILEEELGQPLFDRVGKRVSLTKAGKSFLPFAEQVLFHVNRGRRAIQETANLQTGEIVVGMEPVLISYIAPLVIADLRKAYPSFKVKMVAMPHTRIEEWLMRGVVDAAIAYEVDLEEKFRFEPLFEEEIVFVEPRNQSRAPSGPVRPAHVERCPLVLPPADDRLSLHVYHELKRAGVKAEVVAEAAELESLKRLVKEGIGCSFLPALYVQQFSESDLIASRMAEGNWTRTAGIVHHKEKYLCNATRELIRSIRQVVSSEGARQFLP
ncbi:MAG: LysR substrate-binding domain-containing protein [Alicyclobacillaceae bacterium]|nr:LysR substrate-binding domain-containing protein [Alicyclobacillaceae bacterium]